jgi:2,4-dienoyl-CoA reductase-like NADH-dependent reductase (Old Yellow Enzyme family)
MSTLFSPYALRSLKLPNRIVVSPMCQYVAKNGQANSWHLIHLGGLALSGAGLLFIEATAVEPDGRITPGCLGLWDDATEAALRHLHEFRAPMRLRSSAEILGLPTGLRDRSRAEKLEAGELAWR